MASLSTTSIYSMSTTTATSSTAQTYISLPQQQNMANFQSIPPLPANLDMANLKYRYINNRLFVYQSQPSSSTTLPLAKGDKYCQYLHRHCLQEKLEGYQYCQQHILQDKNAPYKQCSYTHRLTGKKCPNMEKKISKAHNDSREIVYCAEHNKKFNLLNFKTQLMESVTQAGSAPVSREQSLKHRLGELEHYCPNDEHDHRRIACDWEIGEDKAVVASSSLKRKINDSLLEIQNLANIEEECANVTMGDVFNLDNIDSDFEGPESYMEDPLRHADVFSAEELSHILRDKLMRLQTLYTNLISYYKHSLKLKTTEYLIEAKKDKNNDDKLLSTVAARNPYIDPLREEEDLRRLKSMQKYHNIKGKGRLLAQQKRSLHATDPEETSSSKRVRPTCIYPVKEGETCAEVCLVWSNYCENHILYDQSQTLFRPCAAGLDTELPCVEPVISYIHKNTCLMHDDVRQTFEEVDNILPEVRKRQLIEKNDNVHTLSNKELHFPLIDDLDHVDPFNLDTFDLGHSDILS